MHFGYQKNPYKYSCFVQGKKENDTPLLYVYAINAHKESDTLTCCKVVVSEDWDQVERVKRELIFYIHFCNF